MKEWKNWAQRKKTECAKNGEDDDDGENNAKK